MSHQEDVQLLGRFFTLPRLPFKVPAGCALLLPVVPDALLVIVDGVQQIARIVRGDGG